MSELTVVNNDTPQRRSKADSNLLRRCFIVLVASVFGFVFRSFLMADSGIEFGLSKTQHWEIFGASFWFFGMSIVFFSLIVNELLMLRQASPSSMRSPMSRRFDLL